MGKFVVEKPKLTSRIALSTSATTTNLSVDNCSYSSDGCIFQARWKEKFTSISFVAAKTRYFLKLALLFNLSAFMPLFRCFMKVAALQLLRTHQREHKSAPTLQRTNWLEGPVSGVIYKLMDEMITFHFLKCMKRLSSLYIRLSYRTSWSGDPHQPAQWPWEDSESQRKGECDTCSAAHSPLSALTSVCVIAVTFSAVKQHW